MRHWRRRFGRVAEQVQSVDDGRFLEFGRIEQHLNVLRGGIGADLLNTLEGFQDADHTLLVVMMLLGQRAFAAARQAGPWLMRVTAVLFIVTGAFLFYYFAQNYGVYLGQAPIKSATANVFTSRYALIEGADATGYPYQPRILVIPVRQPVQVAITDHIGGCLLSTVFEGLGPGGKAVEITVPVGETRVVQLYAPHPGRYTYHCGGNMYSGTVVAR